MIGEGWADKVPRDTRSGKFCLEAVKTKEWCLSLSSCLKLDFNFLMLVSLPQTEPILLLNARASSNKIKG